MNHYLLPLWNGNGIKSLKYGNLSIPKLLSSMIDYGAKKENIIAKVFGGASPQKITNEQLMIGKKNIIIARDMLREMRIKIVASDVGGIYGRRILMDSQTGKIKLKYAQNSN